MASEVIVALVANAFAKSGKYFEGYYDLLAGLDKLGQLHDLQLDSARGTLQQPAPEHPLSVELRGIHLQHPRVSQPVFQNVDLVVESGERLGIYGTNGSGKSSLLQVIFVVRATQSGQILVDGQDLKEVDRMAYRQNVAYVGKTEIFDGTALENILVGRKNIGIERVRPLLEQLGIDRELAALPEGLHTPLSGAIGPLSAGTAQLLTLARALIGEPRLLLVDEALENIDPERKSAVMAALTDPGAPWTLLLASHDSSELALCSRVVRVDAGRIYS